MHSYQYPGKKQLYCSRSEHDQDPDSEQPQSERCTHPELQTPPRACTTCVSSFGDTFLTRRLKEVLNYFHGGLQPYSEQAGRNRYKVGAEVG